MPHPLSPPSPFTHDLGPYHDTVEHLADLLAATAAARDRAGGTAASERQALRDSGLLALRVPHIHGGKEEPLSLVLRIVRRLAAADSSLAHLFACQHLQVDTVSLFGTPAQQERYFRATREAGWFWGNATSSRDDHLYLQQEGDTYYLNGERSFCSGAAGADALIVNVAHPAQPEARVFLVSPAAGAGITHGHDWDAIGQRQTDSGTVRFARVAINPDALLGWTPGLPLQPPLPRHTLGSCLSQLILTDIYLGNTEGALADALHFVRDHSRPWPTQEVHHASANPLIQLRLGEYWGAYRSARALATDAARALDEAWAQGDTLTAAERGALALRIAEARTTAAQAALAITSGVFDLMGASAAASRLGLDRYWRNVRTHTLHDPLDDKRRALGAWLLEGVLPEPSTYA